MFSMQHTQGDIQKMLTQRENPPRLTFPNALSPNQGKYPKNYAKKLLKKEEKVAPSAGTVLSRSQFQGLLTSSPLLSQYLVPRKEYVKLYWKISVCTCITKNNLNQTQHGSRTLASRT